VAHRLVKREAVGHLRRRQHRDLKDVLEPIEQGAALVVVDRLVRHRQHVVRTEGGQRRVGLAGWPLETLQLLDDSQRSTHARGLAAKRLADEAAGPAGALEPDRKSTRLNSSHVKISYAVFCLKKQKR